MSDSDTERIKTITKLEQQLAQAQRENAILHQRIDELHTECHRLKEELIVHGVVQETFGV